MCNITTLNGYLRHLTALWPLLTLRTRITLSLLRLHTRSTLSLNGVVNCTVYQFTCFPNGLSFCPRTFTKLMKPACAVSRQLGHINSPYIDDSYLQGGSCEECLANVLDTVKMLLSLGFILHPHKSVFTPTQQLVIWGFVLDLVQMKIYLTNEKLASSNQSVTSLSRSKKPLYRRFL